MTSKTLHVRSGLTAIAAVLALSSTPLAAQETSAQPDPLVEAPSEPAPAADPLAPEPTASEPAASETATEPAATAAPVAARRAKPSARTATTGSKPVAAVRAFAPAGAAPAIPTQRVEPVAEAAPLVPSAPLLTEPASPPAAEPVPASTDLLADDALSIAGAAGLGLLTLAGLGLAVRRRRRANELEHVEAGETYLDVQPATPAPVDPEPAFARPVQSAMAATAPDAAVLTDVPRTALPQGFDLSRFGPHVRAAYLGPTPDNPSLSLKYRVRRAAALDHRARLEVEARPEAATPAARPVSKPQRHAEGEGFMLRRAENRQPGRPAFQN